MIVSNQSQMTFEWKGEKISYTSNSDSTETGSEEIPVLHYEPLVTLDRPQENTQSEERETLQGDLIVSEQNVIFVSPPRSSSSSSEESNPSMMMTSFDYTKIILHAITQTPKHGLYIQYQAGSAHSEAEEEDICEIYFIPSSSESVQLVYDALCKGAELHPDPEAESETEELDNSNDDEQDVYYYNDMANIEFSEKGQETLARLNAMLEQTSHSTTGGEQGQFDDAEEEDPQTDFVSR